MGYEVCKADFDGFFAHETGNGTYFAAVLDSMQSRGLIIYDLITRKTEKIEFDEKLSVGSVYAVNISGLSMENKGYRFFADDKEFSDPYSEGFTGLSEFGKPVDSAKVYSKIISKPSLKGFSKDVVLKTNYEDSVLYIAHVRGLTMLDSSVKEGKGTFEGVIRKIPYFKKLGITAVELMPAYEFEDCTETKSEPLNIRTVSSYKDKPGDTKVNYWGFGKGYHFAVKEAYSFSDNPYLELQKMVLKLHEAGLECIFFMYFEPDCSCEYVLDVLKYWVINFHADGFRIMGEKIPFDAIINNPLLKGTKLLFENYNFNDLHYFKPVKYKNVADSGNSFLNAARSFLKSDEDCVSKLSYMLRQNSTSFSPIRNVTDFSGLTLWDMVSYNRKHNEDNNEDNSDGTSYNHSWNMGEEGPTNKRSITANRLKQVRNAALLSFLAQGTPEFVAGDEFLNTQKGNNNPYCQDNEIGWTQNPDTKASRDYFKFLANLLAFRKRHSILHQPKELMLFDYMSCKSPDVSFHSDVAWKFDQTPDSRQFAILYSGEYARQYTGKIEPSVYIVYNMHWEDKEFVIPLSGKKKSARLLYSTDGSTDESFDEEKAIDFSGNKSFVAKGRTISIFLLT